MFSPHLVLDQLIIFVLLRHTSVDIIYRLNSRYRTRFRGLSRNWNVLLAIDHLFYYEWKFVFKMSSFLSENKLDRKSQKQKTICSRFPLVYCLKCFHSLSEHISVDLTWLASNMNTRILILFHVKTVLHLPCTCQKHIRWTKAFSILTILVDRIKTLILTVRDHTHKLLFE